MMKLNIQNLRFKIQKSAICNLQSEMGLTLLEIAISLAILSITLVALSSIFPIGLRASRRASNFSEAGILAQRVIENIKRAAAVYDEGDDGDGVVLDVALIELLQHAGRGIGVELVIFRHFYRFQADDHAVALHIGVGAAETENKQYTNNGQNP